MEGQSRNMSFGDGDQQGKYRKYLAEFKQVRDYLSIHTATATMVAVALDIYRPNLCRHKKDLQDAGVLWVTHKGICQITGYKADYLACNPDLTEGGADGKE
jgi:hypothetical protein